MNKYKLINHKNSAFYGKPMYFENLADAKRELTRVGGQLYRLSDGALWHPEIGWHNAD